MRRVAAPPKPPFHVSRAHLVRTGARLGVDPLTFSEMPVRPIVGGKVAKTIVARASGVPDPADSGAHAALNGYGDVKAGAREDLISRDLGHVEFYAIRGDCVVALLHDEPDLGSLRPQRGSDWAQERQQHPDREYERDMSAFHKRSP